MADNTHIEWADATWNPIVGCSLVSPGCTNCYAMRLAGTGLRHLPTRAGLTDAGNAGPVWNGQVRFVESALDQPLRCRRPRRIFVCAHGDLFHESVPDDWIDCVFGVMALAPQHTFIVLTKRAKRMREYICADRMGYIEEGRAKRLLRERSGNPGHPVMVGKTLAGTWPWPHVWLGVSVEDQPRADERIPELLTTPAAKHFVSAEPLLGPIDATRICVLPRRGIRAGIHINALAGKYFESGVAYTGEWDIEGPIPPDSDRRKIDWVIVGGESGPGARPMHPDWARSLRNQCQAAGVAFFFKQWGEWHPCEQLSEDGPCYPMPGHAPFDSWHAPIFDQSARGPGWNWRRLGKRAAGRMLDGREWSEFPA